MNSNSLILCLNLVVNLQWTSADNEMNTWLNDARYFNLSNILDSPRMDTGQLNNSKVEEKQPVLNSIPGHEASRVLGECQRHQQMIQEGVASGEEWALRFLDASAKWNTGFMTGNLVQPGSYDECLESLAPFRAFKGQHCLLEVDFVVPGLHFNAPVSPMIAMLQYRHNKGERLLWADCSPSTCSPSDVVSTRVAAFNAEFPNNGSVIASISHCRTARGTDFSTADYVAIAFFSFFGLVIVSSTAYDLLTIDAEDRAVVLTSFSFYSNGRVLLSPAVDVLPALHGVRVLTRIWDQIGKLYLEEHIGPMVNRDILTQYYSDWSHVFITNPSFAIDSISFLSGCLVGFNFMKERALGIRFYLAHFYFKRYVRFTCPYAAILLMQSTLFLHFDSGPVWLEHIVPLQENCRESWYTGIIYLGNYIMEENQCFSQVWFNCAEMQMFWLSPLLLFPLWKRPRWGKALVAVLVVLGLVITFLVAFINEVPVGNMSVDGKGALVFLPTHTRYPSWIIGLLTGCLLQDAETSPTTLTPGQLKLGWPVSMGLILLPIIGSHAFQQPGTEYNAVTHSLFISITRPAFTIGLSFVVYACITGHGGPVNTILSWSFFRVTSRVMYSFYLSHTSVLIYLTARSRTPIYISDISMLVMEVACFFITWAVSMLLCLTFEMPFVIIEQYYLGKTGHPRPAARSYSVMLHPSRSAGRHLQMSSSLERDTAEVTAESPLTPVGSLSSIDNPSTIVWKDSLMTEIMDNSSTDHLLTVVQKRLIKRFAPHQFPDDLEMSSSSALQLHRSRSRLTTEEVEARRLAEDSVRVGTDVDVLEQEDGNLKQLQRSRAATSIIKLRARREDRGRGTAELDVFQDYNEERELAEELYFREHGMELSESERSMQSRSRSVVRFSDEQPGGSAESDISDVPLFTEEAGPSGVRWTEGRSQREEAELRERKREEEERRMEERRKREQNRIEKEYAVRKQKSIERRTLSEEERQAKDDENQGRAEEEEKPEEKGKMTEEDARKILVEDKRQKEEDVRKGEEDKTKKQVEDDKEGYEEKAAEMEEQIIKLTEEGKERKEEEKRKRDEEAAKKEEERKKLAEEEKERKEAEKRKRDEEAAKKEEERKKLAEEEKERKEAEKRKRDEEAAKKEEERKKLAEEEKERKEAEKRKRDEEAAKKEEERKKLAEEEKERKEAEKRKRDEEAAKKEEERKNLAEEEKERKEADKRKRDEEAAKKEEERKKLAEEEKERKEADKRKRDEEAAKKEEERKKLAEEEKERKEAEKRKRDEEAAKKEEERKKLAEEEKIRKEEDKRKRDEEAAKKEEESKKLAEEEKKRKEEKRKRDEEAAKKEAERKEKEAERKRKAEEERRSGAGPSRPPGGFDPGDNQDGADPGTSASHWLNAFRRL